MDTVVPQAPQPDNASHSIYSWEDVDAAHADGAPGNTIAAGPQVSQPPADAPAPSAESSRAATVRRVATGAVGVSLLAAGAVVAAKMLRGANAKAGVNVIDFDD